MDQAPPQHCNPPHNLDRRDFLKLAGGGTLALGVSQLMPTISPRFIGHVLASTDTVDYRSNKDLYRSIWQWDKVTWGSHTNACMPGACSFRVYVKDGLVWREEQTANAPASNENYPDYNPLGCQKGCSFHNNLYGDDRVKYPLKRVGERGEGKWQRITWDDALTEVAESIVVGMETHGVDSFVLDAPHVHAGTVAWAGGHRFTALLGGLSPDINVEVGDFYKGFSDTVGKMHTGYSADNLYDSELIFLTCTNWSYTMIPTYHFLTEARYNGTEIVMVAPDYNPTSITADIHVPLRVGTDAAFWLGLCQVMVSENIYDTEFVREQTDQALLIRSDNGHFLRAPELTGEGREDQLFFYDLDSSSVVPAPRGTLAFEGTQALEGSFEVTLVNGEQITVQPAFELLKKRLADYTPEQVQQMTDVPANLVTELGRKVARKVTSSYTGFSSAKSYHGDLWERSMLLVMALSGNWGKPGTGWNTWAMPADGFQAIATMEKPASQGGLQQMADFEEAIKKQVMAADPESNDELASIEAIKLMTKKLGVVPPVFWLYYHCGYKELYDRKEWQDPALKKSFSDYMQESLDKGWYTPDQVRPKPGHDPQVLLLISHNPIRRLRSGAIKYPKVLFPKLKMLFAIEARMSASAMYCDIVLPAAWYYEKTDMPISMTANPRFPLIQQAAPPQGEARPEWEIFAALAKRVSEIAAERNTAGYTDIFGGEHQFSDLYKRFTMDGHLLTHEDVVREMVEINVASGIMPKGYSYEQFEKDGQIPQQGVGSTFMTEIVANDFDAKKPFYSLRHHVDDKKIFPTYNRRAQFYIDHDWYLDADEHLPIHKAPPKIGGDREFQITGGHPRHSIHATHMGQNLLLRMHRGQPVMHMNDQDALAKGLTDGEIARVSNDFSDFDVMIRTSPSVGRNQVIVYFWEAYQFKGWKVLDRLLIGLPKALHFAGGYGQLRYYFYNGSPAPCTDRGVFVSVEKA